MNEIRCTVTGKVQGVCFRDYVQSSAMDLGLFGYTKNQNDGSVLVVAQGESEALREFVEYLHEGSSLSTVEGVAVEWGTARVVYDDFSILQ